MKRFFLVFCLGVIFSIQAREYLISVDGLNDTEKLDFFVTEQIGNHFLILANDNDMRKIKQRHYSYQILEIDPKPDEKVKYYLVYPVLEKGAQIEREIFARYGTVLKVYENILIMKANELDLLYMKECIVEIDLIDFSPVCYISGKPSSIYKQQVDYNPLIEQILQEIHPDSCNSFLFELCAMWTRDSESKEWNKGKMVPYLEQKFIAYGCDSTFQVPVSGYDAPAIVGIRFGKKDSSTKRFVLIGAHPDIILNSGVDRHQGANDNTTGTVGFLECCRVMQDFDFENTIMFAGFNTEEHGLLGSKELFNMFKEQGCDIIGSISYDMMGIGEPSDKSQMFSYYDDIPGCKDFAESFISIAETYKSPYTATLREITDFNVPTDIKNIWKNGFIGVSHGGCSGQGENHTKADSIGDKFDTTHLAKAVFTGIAVMAHYAVPIKPTNIETGNGLEFNNLALTVHQNFNRHITIYFNQESSLSQASLQIYNSAGQLITTLIPFKNSNARYTALWKGTDSRGKPIGTGLYLVHYTTQKAKHVKKILFIRK